MIKTHHLWKRSGAGDPEISVQAVLVRKAGPPHIEGRLRGQQMPCPQASRHCPRCRAQRPPCSSAAPTPSRACRPAPEHAEPGAPERPALGLPLAFRPPPAHSARGSGGQSVWAAGPSPALLTACPSHQPIQLQPSRPENVYSSINTLPHHFLLCVPAPPQPCPPGWWGPQR